MSGRSAALLVLVLAFGCESPPAAPSPPVVVAPAPAAVSVDIDPTTARVGEEVTFTYRLSRALEDDLEFWTEHTRDGGAPWTSGPLTIRRGETVLEMAS